MDYLKGQSLSNVLRTTGPMSEDAALQYIRPVADALRYVHSRNRLHLDIKPANIMVTDDGRVILIDFGSSKQYDEVNGENSSTLRGMTPGYAPPEQMSHKMTHFLPASDIYALGATFYRLLTDKLIPDATERISGEPVEPLPSTISDTTRAAIYSALNLNKNQRPQTIDEFLQLLDIDPATPTPPVPPIPADPEPPIPIDFDDDKPRRRQSKKWLTIIGILLLTCIATGAILYLTKTDTPAPTPPKTVPENVPTRVADVTLSTPGINAHIVAPDTPATPATPATSDNSYNSDNTTGTKATPAASTKAIENPRTTSTFEPAGGSEPVKTNFDFIGDYHDDLAAVKDYNGKWGFINKKGNEVIPFSYGSAGKFKNGKATVTTTPNGKEISIDKNGNQVVDKPKSDKEQKAAVENAFGVPHQVHPRGKTL